MPPSSVHKALSMAAWWRDSYPVRNHPPAEYAGIIVLELPDDAIAATAVKVLESLLSQPELLAHVPGRLAIVESWRVPHRHEPLALWRAVVLHRLHREPAQVRSQDVGLADGGGTADEGGIGAVPEGQPAEAAQHVGDVAPEYPAEGVELVHDHIPQPTEERRPAIVVRK